MPPVSAWFQNKLGTRLRFATQHFKPSLLGSLCRLMSESQLWTSWPHLWTLQLETFCLWQSCKVELWFMEKAQATRVWRTAAITKVPVEFNFSPKSRVGFFFSSCFFQYLLEFLWQEVRSFFVSCQMNSEAPRRTFNEMPTKPPRSSSYTF